MSMFSERLKECRKRHSLTQRELAKRLGIATSAVGMYEQGRREPDSNMLLKICSVLNTTTDYLLGLDSRISKEDSDAERDVNDVIDEFTDMLEGQSGLMFNGQPMNDDDRHKVVEAIKIAAAVAINGRRKSEGAYE